MGVVLLDMMRIKTKKVGAGYYETTNTNPIYYIEKSYDGGNYWTLCDEDYHRFGDGYFSTWETKRDCIEIIKERDM